MYIYIHTYTYKILHKQLNICAHVQKDKKSHARLHIQGINAMNIKIMLMCVCVCVHAESHWFVWSQCFIA